MAGPTSISEQWANESPDAAGGMSRFERSATSDASSQHSPRSFFTASVGAYA